MAGQQKARARKVRIFERRKKVYELASSGLTFEQVGEQLGVSKAQAWKDWQAWWDSEPPKDVDRARREEVQRIDKDVARTEVLLRSWMSRAAGSDGGEPDEKAARVVADLIGKRALLSARRSKVLGLDAPERQEITNPDGSLRPQIFVPPERGAGETVPSATPNAGT